MTANQSAAPNNDNAVAAPPPAAAATAIPAASSAATASSTTPNISPIKTSSKKSSPSPSSSAASKTATAKIASKKDSAVDNIKFTSTTNKKSSPSKSSHNTTANELKQLKLQRAEIAKREIKEMEAMERAFREDMMVWSGPNNVVFPRRYHTLMQLKNNSSSNSNNGVGERGGKKKGSEGGSGDNNNNKKEKEYYGSQSQGWMYGDGLARLGQLNWMDVTSPPSSSSGGSGSGSPSKRKKVDTSSSGFLMDDVTIIDKALQSSGLTRSNLTPRAYACLLEQARRYTLELLADAQDYALHAARDSISTLLPCDLLLAAEMREDVHGISSTLPCVEDIQGMADEVNRVPLPAIPRDCYGGVVLPPVEDQLTARTFDVVNGARVVQRMLRGGDYPMSLGDVGRGGGGGGTSSSTKRKVGSYGAGIGRQIAVNLKSSKKGEALGSTDKDVGTTASASPSQPSKASKASSSGSKGQKRKLTAL